MTLKTALALTVAGAALAAGSPARADTVQITGAGSSFAAPIYSAWGLAAATPVGIQLNYGSVGSGAGVKAVTERNVDFGASDAPVPADKLTAAHLVQFPAVMGAVVLTANVPNLKEALKLDGPTVAAIYEGKITKWNDPKIAALNAGVTLPSIAIAPVYRGDASGTTFVFTSYLAMVAPDWKSTVGAATSVKWPAGTGANNSAGVASTVGQVRGGLGYVEYSYAVQNKLSMVDLTTHDGQVIAPTIANFQAAAAKADWSHAQNLAVSILDMPGATSWPIVTPTYVLVPSDPKDATKADAVLRMFDWAFKNGGPAAQNMAYVPLPDAVEEQIRSVWMTAIKGANGGPIYQ